MEFHAIHPELRVIFVNDGSTDSTLDLLQSIVAGLDGTAVIVDRHSNSGKAEAVRVGIMEALSQGPQFVGYWDADLATPLDEMPRFIEVLRSEPRYEMVLGARVMLLGRLIERRARRHYLGRIFATFTSLALGLQIYDTQCGAKMFRVSAGLEDLFRETFLAGWAFDVEIIARLIASPRHRGSSSVSEVIYELPLRRWHDVPGSKVRPSDFVIAVWDLVRIYWRYLRR